MLQVGVTGGIGSGKSIVCALFKCLEIPVFNADTAGRQLLAEDATILEQVKKSLGMQIITNGKPDRKKIAEIVFNNPDKLEQLNSIIHPAVRKTFDKWALDQKSPYIINEAAILFETGTYKKLNYTILVTAPEQLRIKRVMERDNMDETSVRNRMKNQWSEEEKNKLADFIIINDDIKPLLPQVTNIHATLIARSK